MNHLRSLTLITPPRHALDVPARLADRVLALEAEARGLERAIERDGHASVGKARLARRLAEIGRLRRELEPHGAPSLERALERSEAASRFALELWKNRRSNLLEWLIVGLIVVDILIARL